MSKLNFGLMFFFIVLFGGCQTKTDNANSSNSPNKATNQAILRVSAPENEAAEPAIAADAGGNTFVVYVEHGTEKSADIYLQKFDKEIKPIGERIRVNPEKGQVKAWFGDPPTIKIGSDQTIFIGWTAKVESAEKPNANVLNLSVSRDGGRSFEAPVKVNDDTAPGSHGMHSLAIGKDNHVLMAWLDERNIKSEPKIVETQMKHEMAEPNSEVFFTVSNDGGKTFSPNKKLSSEVCPCCKTNLAVAADGKIYASWRQVLEGDFRHIAVAESENDGASFSDPVIVRDDQWQINACPVSGAPIKIGRENTLKIVWFTSGKASAPGLYASESKDGGQTFLPAKLISEQIVSGTPVLLSDEKGNWQAVWESEMKIYHSDLQNPAEAIGDGMYPSAVLSGGRLVTVFIKKDSEKRAVWISAAAH